MSQITDAANPNRYDEAAKYYREGRLDYSDRLIRDVVETSGIGPDSVVLDLGCGPGSVANKIAAYCGRVIAVDTSLAMIEMGKIDAPDNVEYVHGSANDLSFLGEKVDLVTFGRSFHWMEREATLAALDDLVKPDGMLAFVFVSPMKGKSPDHEWYNALLRAARRLDTMHKTGDTIPQTADEPGQFIMMRSAFSDLTMWCHYETVEWDIDRVKAWTLSRYATNTGLSTSEDPRKPRMRKIETELDNALSPFGEGPWMTRNIQRALYAKRPRPE